MARFFTCTGFFCDQAFFSNKKEVFLRSFGNNLCIITTRTTEKISIALLWLKKEGQRLVYTDFISFDDRPRHECFIKRREVFKGAESRNSA